MWDLERIREGSDKDLRYMDIEQIWNGSGKNPGLDSPQIRSKYVFTGIWMVIGI